MINYSELLTTICTQLNQAELGGRFIRAFPNANKEQDPYCEVKVLSPFITESDHPDALLDYNSTQTTLTERRTEQSRVELSFNFISTNEVEALTLMSKTREYFEFVGYDNLADNGIIKVEISGSQNRTAILVTEYEFKYGFDVLFRVEDVSTRDINFIETVEYEIV